jgi:hypothetical protein
MKYDAILTRSEVIEFNLFFYDLEVAKVTTMTVKPIGPDIFSVPLEPGEAGVEFLRAEFKNGLLSHRGWGDHFKRTK